MQYLSEKTKCFICNAVIEGTKEKTAEDDKK